MKGTASALHPHEIPPPQPRRSPTPPPIASSLPQPTPSPPAWRYNNMMKQRLKQHEHVIATTPNKLLQQIS